MEVIVRDSWDLGALTAASVLDTMDSTSNSAGNCRSVGRQKGGQLWEEGEGKASGLGQIRQHQQQVAHGSWQGPAEED